MSSALLQLIPVLDGTNYTVWARSMEAFLRSQQLWRMAAGWTWFPANPAVTAAILAGTVAPATTEKYVKLQEEWNASNDAIIGNLMCYAFFFMPTLPLFFCPFPDSNL